MPRKTDNTPRKTGRPTKRDPQREDRLLNYLRAGLHKETAARSAGIDPSTFYDWQRRFPQFSEAVEKAVSDAEAILVGKIQQAASEGKNWTAAAWMLERRHPDRWARSDRLQIQGEIRAEVTLAGLRDAVAASRARRKAQGPAEADSAPTA